MDGSARGASDMKEGLFVFFSGRQLSCKQAPNLKNDRVKLDVICVC